MNENKQTNINLAMAIINGTISPINPEDPKPLHVFACHNIFFCEVVGWKNKQTWM